MYQIDSGLHLRGVIHYITYLDFEKPTSSAFGQVGKHEGHSMFRLISRRVVQSDDIHIDGETFNALGKFVDVSETWNKK